MKAASPRIWEPERNQSELRSNPCCFSTRWGKLSHWVTLESSARTLNVLHLHLLFGLCDCKDFPVVPHALPEETLLVCPWSERFSSCRKSSTKGPFKVHSSYITAHLSQMSFLEGCRQTKPHKITVCSWLDVLWTQLPDQKATFTCSLTSAGIANYSSSTEELCYQVLEIYYSATLFSPPPPRDYLHFSL